MSVVNKKELRRTCNSLVGRNVRFTGKNGNEFDKAGHGKPISGTGKLLEVHDSHGLCIIVQKDDIKGTMLCIDVETVRAV